MSTTNPQPITIGELLDNAAAKGSPFRMIGRKGTFAGSFVEAGGIGGFAPSREVPGKRGKMDNFRGWKLGHFSFYLLSAARLPCSPTPAVRVAPVD